MSHRDSVRVAIGVGFEEFSHSASGSDGLLPAQTQS